MTQADTKNAKTTKTNNTKTKSSNKDTHKTASADESGHQRLIIERVREPREAGDVRILVDRLWPRGVSKEKADLDEWAKGATPSTDLRKAIHGGDVEWAEFSERYRHELTESGGLDELAETVRESLKDPKARITLLIAADPSKRNHAEVLRDALLTREDIEL